MNPKASPTSISASLIALLFLQVPSPVLSAPPEELTGQFLYFEEGPDDFLNFLDGTNGEERDLAGDIDPFTYTYTISGPNTATLVATYDAIDGDFDEWDLTWTANGTGTFVRREFRNNVLEDTDTGGFQENSGVDFPPSDLTGVRLEEVAEPEAERFEFLTDTVGREFEPGDVDPFTYVYAETGAATANLVATFKSDRWDDIDLSFESETAGTFVRQRFDDNVLKDEKRGDFRLARNTNTADLAIGKLPGRLIGDDFYNASGARQTVRVVTRRGGGERFQAEVENDGDDDVLRARSSRGSRKFDVDYFVAGSRKNVTGAITRGRGISTGSLSHDDRLRLAITARPRRQRGSLNLILRGSSSTNPGARDLVRARLTKR